MLELVLDQSVERRLGQIFQHQVIVQDRQSAERMLKKTVNENSTNRCPPKPVVFRSRFYVPGKMYCNYSCVMHTFLCQKKKGCLCINLPSSIHEWLICVRNMPKKRTGNRLVFEGKLKNRFNLSTSPVHPLWAEIMYFSTRKYWQKTTSNWYQWPPHKGYCTYKNILTGA